MTLKTKFLTAFSAVLLFCVLFAGCTGNKGESVAPVEESMALSDYDTTMVCDLMQQYFNCLQNKDYDAAMAMIYQLRNDSLLEVDSEILYHYLMGMKMVSPQRYEIEDIVFLKERDCLVKYSAVLFEKENEDDRRPNKMFYTLRPIRVHGQWYLTVSDKDDMNTRDSKIVN